jgi:hypothetical protein
VLPTDVVLRSCSTADLEAAASAGGVVAVEWRGGPAWSLMAVAEAEELLADGLLMLAQDNRLAVVVGPDSVARAAALATALGSGVPSVVLDDAHLLGVEAALAAVEDLPEDAVLALSLDNGLPLGEVVGAVALDVAASGVCPVLRAEPARPRSTLAAARNEVAAGRWPSADPADRSFVVVPVESPDEALVRVSQLVSTSIPRAFGHAGAAIAVVSLDEHGPTGLAAIRVALGGLAAEARPDVVGPSAVLTRTWPAVVAVLPGVVTPALTRAAVYAALRAGAEHVSVVHGFGVDAAPLVAVVATTTDRPRRTRLAELLAGG